jgi:hypothetical protein
VHAGSFHRPTGSIILDQSPRVDRCRGQTVVLVSTMRIDDGLLQSKQHTEPLAHIGNDVGRSLRLERDSPRLPVQVLHVIGEDDP